MTPPTLETGAKSEVRARGPCRRHREELLPGALDFAAAGHLTATHLLHAFAARCPPPLARWDGRRPASPVSRRPNRS